VKFILCTTEVSRVPETIRSRCQRFDFRPIPTARIADQLRRILAAEGMEADDEAVAQVARLGHGSMRDALSVMDRLLAAGQSRLTADMVADMLGLPEQALVTAVVQAIIARDAAAVLAAGAELLARGASVEQALESLIDHLRNMMIASSAGSESELLELSNESREVIAAQSKNFDAAALVYMIALCEATARHARGATAARAMYDAVLVRLALAESLASIPALLAGGEDRPAPRGDGEKKKSGEAPGTRIESPRSAGAQEAELKPLIETLRAPATATTEVATLQAASSSPGTSDSLDGLGLWQRVLAGGGSSPADQAKLAHLHPESFDGRTLRLRIGSDAGAMTGFLRTQTAWVAAAVRRATGLSIRVELASPTDHATESARPRERIVEEVLQLPLVKQAMELLDAAVVDVVAGESNAAPGSAQEPDRV
jgi:DNA polymerase III gamma/tau subunit